MAKLILITSILISLSIRLLFISQSVHTADIYLMYNMGVSYLEGNNPYLDVDFNSYPPFAIFLEALTLSIPADLNLSFVTLFKLWPNLADFICALIIYKFLIKSKVKPTPASLWTAFYLLNPVSILISSAHGQLDSITSLLVVLALYLITFPSSKSSYALSALSLGVAVAIKPNPLMLVPAFLLFKQTDLKQKVTYLVFTLSPLALSFIPFILESPIEILSRILTYSGTGDISYAAVLRSLWYQNNAQTTLPLTAELLSASKLLFLTSTLTLIILSCGWKQLIKTCLSIYLLFLVTYFGIASQYLVWIIPLAVLVQDKRVVIYSILASVSLVSFYLFFSPDILLGKFYTLTPYQTKHIYLYFLSNLLFWGFNLWWLSKIILSSTPEIYPRLGSRRKRLVLISLALVLISSLPVIQLLSKLPNYT